MITNPIQNINFSSFENSREGISISNPRIVDNPLIYVNKGFCLMTGYEKEEVIGKNCRFLQGTKMNQVSIKKLSLAISNNESTKQEILNFKKDGTPFWNSLSLTPIFDESNTLSYILGIQEDITARKEKEVLQRKIYDKILISKTTLIAEEKQRNRLGEELHDNVNQILATLKLYLAMALKEKNQRMQMLQKSEDILIMAMDEIRKLSKVLVASSKRQSTLHLAVSKLINSIQIAVPFIIEFQYDEDIEKNLSENMWLTFYRIIQEQLNNTIKYAKPNIVKIKFSMDSEMIHLSIKDDGVGFNKNIISTGIGLKNMKHRVELENGNFTFETSIGNGCEINIDLPYAQYLLADSNKFY